MFPSTTWSLSVSPRDDSSQAPIGDDQSPATSIDDDVGISYNIEHLHLRLQEFKLTSISMFCPITITIKLRFLEATKGLYREAACQTLFLDWFLFILIIHLNKQLYYFGKFV